MSGYRTPPEHTQPEEATREARASVPWAFAIMAVVVVVVIAIGAILKFAT